MELDELLNDEYENLKKAEKYSIKFNIISNIIQIKNENNSLNRINQTLRKDLTDLIEYQIGQSQESQLGYNKIQLELIKEIASGIDDLNLRLSFLAQLVKKLSDNGFENEKSYLQNLLNGHKIVYFFRNLSFTNFFLLIHAIISYNLLTLIVGLLLYWGVISIFLLPTENLNFQLLKIEYINIHNNEYYNHFLNVLSLIVIDDGMEITPLNARGLALVIMAKILFFALIGNFVFVKLYEKFKI